MAIGQAIQEARENMGLTQSAMGSRVCVSDKTISAVENGQRSNPEVIRDLAAALDDSRVYMEAAERSTGGVFTAPYLDGEAVDMHRSTVRAKFLEEIEEALQAVRRAAMITNPACVSPNELADVQEALHQLVEAQTATTNLIAVMCRSYKQSATALYQEHRRELQAKGIIQGR